MKKMMLLLIVVTVSVATKAQVQQDKLSSIDNKGNLLVGGNFKANLSFKGNRSSGGYDIAFSPRLGYYFFKGFAAGIDLNGQYAKEEHQKTSSFGAGPFVRYHILPLLFTEISYDYNTKDLTVYPSNITKPVANTIYHDNVYSAGLGYIVVLHKHLTLEPRIDYSITTANNAIQSQGPEFSISLHNYFWK